MSQIFILKYFIKKLLITEKTINIEINVSAQNYIVELVKKISI